jgi:hypothetical protein
MYLTKEIKDPNLHRICLGEGGKISTAFRFLDRWLGRFLLPQNDVFGLFNSRKSCGDQRPRRGLEDDAQMWQEERKRHD